MMPITIPTQISLPAEPCIGSLKSELLNHRRKRRTNPHGGTIIQLSNVLSTKKRVFTAYLSDPVHILFT